MVTIGVDVHKRTSSYCILDEQGTKVKTCKLENSRESIREFVGSLSGPKELAIEATRSWGLYHDTVSDLVDNFYLGHPYKMKAITESETKHDKRDAEYIARLTQASFLPTAHVSSLDTRQLRSLLRFRNFLMRQRKAIRNQVHILIDRNFFPADRPGSFKDPFCKRGMEWLLTVQLPERERHILDHCLRSYLEFSEKIVSLERYTTDETLSLPGLEYIHTIPGFRHSRINALIVLLETDNVHRFHKGRGFLHYAGLVPRENSSGDKHRTGRLVKRANMFLRTAFIESALAATRADKGLRDYYASVKEHAGSGSAVIAVARKLALITYHVLKEQRSYRPFNHGSPAAAYRLCAVSSQQ